MAKIDTKTAAHPSTALVLMFTGFGALFIVIGVIALVTTDPTSWVGVGLALFVGVYSFVMAQVIKRRRARRQ